jgi:hypothetical protein
MEDKKENILDQIREFLAQNPEYFGLLIAVFGVFFLLAGIFNFDWVFRGRSYSLKKFEGISNIIGRKAARVICGFLGIMMIVFGAVVLILAKKNMVSF